VSFDSTGEVPASAVGTTFHPRPAQKVLKQAESRGQSSPGVHYVFLLKLWQQAQGQSRIGRQEGEVPQVCPGGAGPESAVISSAGTNPPEEKDARPPGPLAAVDAATWPPPNTRPSPRCPKEDTNLPNNRCHEDIAAEEDEVMTDFLAPPQQPDEIGPARVCTSAEDSPAPAQWALVSKGGRSVAEARCGHSKRCCQPSRAQRLGQEALFCAKAQAAAGIKHNNIVTIFQVSEDRGIPFLAMEFLKANRSTKGSSGKRYCRWPRRCALAGKWPRGMAAAHEEGLIHRDIKPAKHLARRQEGPCQDPRLRSGPVHRRSSPLTQSGAIIGNPGLHVPRAMPAGKLDARSTCGAWCDALPHVHRELPSRATTPWRR